MARSNPWIDTLRDCEGHGCRVVDLDSASSEAQVEELRADEVPQAAIEFGHLWVSKQSTPWHTLVRSGELTAEDPSVFDWSSGVLRSLEALVSRADRAAIVWGGSGARTSPNPWSYLLQIPALDPEQFPGYVRLHLPATLSSFHEAELALKMKLPRSYIQFASLSNGLGLDAVEVVSVFGVGSERADWSVVTSGKWLDCSYYHEITARWREFQGIYSYERERDFQRGTNTFVSDEKVLVPFMITFFADAWCFDRSRQRADNECPVVFWDHELRKATDGFVDFSAWMAARLEAEVFALD